MFYSRFNFFEVKRPFINTNKKMLPSSAGGASFAANSFNYIPEPPQSDSDEKNSKASFQNQKYVRNIVRSADPIMSIQKDRESLMEQRDLPRICWVSFYPRQNEEFILPISKHFFKNGNKGTVLSLFILPDDAYKIYFESIDPLRIKASLQKIPELASGKINMDMTDKSDFVSSFCNMTAVKQFQVGNFVRIASPENFGDVGQIVKTDPHQMRCYLKIIPRIDYEQIQKNNVQTQSQLNPKMPPNYVPPKNFFDKDKLLSLNPNIRIGTDHFQIDDEIEINVNTWDDNKYYGKFQYKLFLYNELQTISSNFKEEELEPFITNVFENERFINGFTSSREFRNFKRNPNIIALAPDLKTAFHKSFEYTKNFGIDSPKQTDKSPLLSSSSTNNQEKHPKKKSFFMIDSPNSEKSSKEPTSKTEMEKETKELKPPKAPEKITKESNIQKESKASNNQAKAGNDPLCKGARVISQFGNYSGILCKVKESGDIITAKVSPEPFVAIDFKDFQLEKLYDRQEYSSSETESTNEIDQIDEGPNNFVEKVDKGVQYEPYMNIIPRDGDLVEINFHNARKKAILLENHELIEVSNDTKRKEKGAERLMSRVILDDNITTDSKGERLNIGEEIRITRGMYSSKFAHIAHITDSSLFVTIDKEGNSDSTKKFVKIPSHYALKFKYVNSNAINSEDILNLKIVTIVQGAVSNPKRIVKVGTDGYIYLDDGKRVNMKDYNSKWMFDDAILSSK